MKIKLTELEKETLSYNDVAYLVLTNYKTKMKIQQLFERVIKILDKTNEDYENDIEDFFLILMTDKRFIMTDKGYWHLKDTISVKNIKKAHTNLDDDLEDELLLDIESEIDETPEESTDDYEYEEDEDEDIDVISQLKIENEDDL